MLIRPTVIIIIPLSRVFSRLIVASYTVMHVAAKGGKADCVAELLQANVDLAAENWHRFTALQLACLHGNLRTTQLLLNRAHPDEAELIKCAYYAAAGGQYDTLQMLVQDHSVSIEATHHGWSLLHAAASYHRLNCVGYLLSIGASANELSHGCTVMELAFEDQDRLSVTVSGVSRPFGKHSAFSTQRRDAIVSLLLTHGAEIDESSTRQECTCCGDSHDTAPDHVPDYARKLRAELQQKDAALRLLHNYMQEASTTRSLYADQPGHMQVHDTERGSTIKLQLVHARTGHLGEKVYSLNLALLTDLHRNSGGETPSVLINMIQPPEGFSSTEAASSMTSTQPATSRTVPVKLLQYDGALQHLHQHA